MHGAPGEHRVSGAQVDPSHVPGRGGGRCREVRAVALRRGGRLVLASPGVQEHVDIGGDVVAQKDDFRHDDRGEDQDRQQPGTDAPSGRPGPPRSALCRRRVRRSGRLTGPPGTARGPPGPADRAHQRSELGADRCAVARSGLLQPPGDDGDAGEGQVLHRPVELGQALVGGRTSGGTGQPGGRCDVREDRAGRTPGRTGRGRVPAVRGGTEDDPAISRDDRNASDVVAAVAVDAWRRFRGREHTRADLESLRRGEPGQGEESAQLHPTGGGRGRIGPLSLVSVGEWREVRVLTLGDPSSRQVRHRQHPRPADAA